MPKSKVADKKPEKEKIVKKPGEEADKIIEIAEEDVLEDELVDGEDDLVDGEEDEAVLDPEEVDPFNDKYEQ